MTDYYGYQNYHASPYASSYLRNDMEYNGYNNAWMIGRGERGASHDARGYSHHYSPSYGHDAYHHDHSRSQSRSRSQHYNRYDRSEFARLAWPTEIPVKLRVPLCCEECKLKLDEELRDIEGVYDVGIMGWSNALITVTGTASAQKILERARRSSTHAEFWPESSYGW